MVEFCTSKTKENLMKAFAGESQARNRYTFAAQKAKEKGYYLLEQVFLYTAGQEKEHAEIFYNYLKPCAGENIQISGGYPVDISENVAELLRMAVHTEFEEHDDVDKQFAKVAKEEGFLEISATFEKIAEIEKTHGQRFQYYAQLLESGQLFEEADSGAFVCMNCGYIHHGTKAPKSCPVCKHDQGYFIRSEKAPY